MKRFISALIIAVMLFCAFPLTFVAAAEITYTPIALGVETPVSVSKTNVEKDFTFTAPEDGDYAFYSLGDCDTRGYAFEVTDGSFITTDDDYNDMNFFVEFYLSKGEKINLKTTMYNFINSGDYKVVVNKRGDATSIVPEKSTLNVYVGTHFGINYLFAPLSAYSENVEFIPADTSIVSNEHGSLYAEKVGATTVKLKSENGLEANVSVNVIAPKKLELNKTETASGEGYYRFVFTPAETGCYTFFADFASDGYVGIDMAEEIPSSEGRSYRLEKGTEYLIYVENFSELEMSLTVKKAVMAEDFSIYCYSELIYENQTAAIVVEPINGALTEEIQWTVDDELVELRDTGYAGEVVAFLKKEGTATITATIGEDSDSITLDISKLPIVTLETPYSENTFRYENVFAQFVAAKDGYYRISAEDSLGYKVRTGLLGEYEGDGYVNAYLYKDQAYTLFAYRDENNETYEEGTITIKVQELPKAVSATPVKSTIDAVVDQEVKLLLNKQPAACYFEGGAIWSTESGNCEIYQDFDDGFFYAYAAGTYTAKFESDGISAEITVNVTEPESLTLGQEKKQAVKQEHGNYVYKFTPAKSGIYTPDILSGDVGFDISNEMLGTAMSGNAYSLVGGIEYKVMVYPSDDEDEFTLKLRNSELATQIIATNPYVFTVVGEQIWAPYYTVDGDNEEYIETINIADTNVAHANYEIIVAKAPGETEVEMVTTTGLKAKFILVVYAKNHVGIDDIALDKEELTLDVGKSEKLIATTTPKTNSKVYWWSGDESVATVDQNGRVTAVTEGETYIVAYADGMMAMCNIITKAPAIVESSKVFTDIKAGKWYTNAVDYAYSYGFIAGVSKTEFGLNQPVTRGMFITILARIAGVDTSGAANKAAKTKFTDVKVGKFYTAAIKWASENGVVNGLTESTFGPDAAIERQQLCVMIVNFAKYMGVQLTESKPEIIFKDNAKFAKYAKNAIAVCQKANIISGYGVSGGYEFRPKNTATRGEAAQILYKFHKDFVMK